MMLETVWDTSKTIRNGRTVQDILCAAMAEMGELAEEVKIKYGPHYKSGGPDGIRGEAVDVIQCLVDLIYIDSDGEATVDEIEGIMAQKLAKWRVCEAGRELDRSIEHHLANSPSASDMGLNPRSKDKPSGIDITLAGIRADPSLELMNDTDEGGDALTLIASNMFQEDPDDIEVIREDYTQQPEPNRAEEWVLRGAFQNDKELSDWFRKRCRAKDTTVPVSDGNGGPEVGYATVNAGGTAKVEITEGKFADRLRKSLAPSKKPWSLSIDGHVRVK